MLSLRDNLKNLQSVRRRLVVDLGAPGTIPAVVSELQLEMLVDYALDRLGIRKVPDNAAGLNAVIPVLMTYIRIRGIGTGGNQVVAIGTSLALQEQVLLPRAFVGWPPVNIPNTIPTNALVQTWATDDAASVVNVSTARDQVSTDLGRLLDDFAREWKIVNP